MTLMNILQPSAISSDSRTSGWGLGVTSYGGNTLNICYESRSIGDRELVSVTQNLFAHVQSQFARTNLSLQGFGSCGPRSATNEVRLTWMDAEDFPEPDTKGLRERLQGVSQIGNGRIYGGGPLGFPQRIQSPVMAEPTLALNGYVFRKMEKVKGISNATSYFKSVLLHEMGRANRHGIGI